MAALSHLKLEATEEARALKQICVQARHQMLDQLVAYRLSRGQPLPWELIHAFLDSRVDGAALFDQLESAPTSSATIPKEWLEVRMQADSDCKVSEVLVRTGQQVKAGDALLTAETHKSFNRLALSSLRFSSAHQRQARRPHRCRRTRCLHRAHEPNTASNRPDQRVLLVECPDSSDGKLVSGTYGHATGDLVPQMVARRSETSCGRF